MNKKEWQKKKQAMRQKETEDRNKLHREEK